MTPDADPFFVYDADLGVWVSFLALPRKDVIFVKLMLESYEALAMARTVDPHWEDGIALIVVFSVNDFIETTRIVMAELVETTGARPVPPGDGHLDELRATVAEWANG
jgi:hypothetical protein